jgi:uncharacterized sulfatase
MKAASIAAAGCLIGDVCGAEKQSKPNILIVLGDDCTWNDTPLYGGSNVKMPRLMNLASEGKTFNRAFMTMAMCQPCRTELYTGQYPMTTGTCWNHCVSLPGTKSICHHLGALGYRVGIAGKTHIAPRSSFPFDNVKGYTDNCVAPTVEADPTWIKEYMQGEKGSDEPFCLVVGLVVPHAVWSVGDPSHFNLGRLTLPDNFANTMATRENYAKYLAEIEVLDRQLGDILDTLESTGKADNTIVIFSTEQGAQFPGCKWNNYDAGIRTGMVWRWPNRIKPNTRTDAMVQYADVMPTLLEIASGKAQNDKFDGSSFLQVLTGEKDSHRQYTYGMHNNLPEGQPYPIRSVRDERYRYIRNLSSENLYINKYVMGKDHTSYWLSWMFAAGEHEKAHHLVSRYMHRPPEELYDLENDPMEMDNLISMKSMEPIKLRLSAELDSWMAQQGDLGAIVDTHEVYDAARNRPRG